jgi:hypothetical protein
MKIFLYLLSLIAAITANAIIIAPAQADNNGLPEAEMPRWLESCTCWYVAWDC